MQDCRNSSANAPELLQSSKCLNSNLIMETRFCYHVVSDDLIMLVGLDLFNDDTRPSGHISRPRPDHVTHLYVRTYTCGVGTLVKLWPCGIIVSSFTKIWIMKSLIFCKKNAFENIINQWQRKTDVSTMWPKISKTKFSNVFCWKTSLFLTQILLFCF